MNKCYYLSYSRICAHIRCVFIVGLLILAFVYSIGCLAQGMSNINYLNGLNGEHVNKIYKDSYGIVWVGTNRGVSAYNGHTLINVKADDGKTFSVNDITDGINQEVLIASEVGIYKVIFSSLTCERVMPSIQHADVFCRIGDSLYIGGVDGIYETNAKGKVRCFGIENNVMSQGNHVFDMCAEGKEGTDSLLWLCTADKVVSFNRFTHHLADYSLKDDLAGGQATCIAKTGNLLCVGTSNAGLLYFDPRTHAVRKSHSVASPFVRDLNVDQRGLLYVSGNFSYVIDAVSDTLITKLGKTSKNGLSASQLPTDGSYTFWHDDQLGINWFGFFVEGFSHDYYKHNTLNLYRYKSLDTSQMDVRSFCRHADDLLIGTRNGLYYVNERLSRMIEWDANELGAHVVTNICWFSNRFVVSTYDGGVRVFDPLSLKLSPPLPGLDGNFSTLTCSPDSSLLYAAGSQGLFVLNRNFSLVHHFNPYNSELPDTYLSELFFDQNGKGWISTLSGLCLLDVGKGRVLVHGFPKDFFNGIGLLSFNQALDGDILAFVNDTIFKVKPDLSQYKRIDLSNVLGAGAINFIYGYKQHYWVGTTYGLYLFDNQFKQYVHFSESDGLPSLDFNKQQVQLMDDGTLWMANCQGLIFVNPDQVIHQTDSIVGKVVVDYMLIDKRIVEPSRLLELVRHPSLTLHWNFGQESLGLVPLLLNYANVGGRFYEYAIDNGDFSSKREGERIEIEGLSLGRHCITLRLAGHPETTSLLKVNVVPSSLFWFELLFVLLLCIAVYSLYVWVRHLRRYRLMQLTKHELEYKLIAQQAVRKHQEQEKLEQEANERAQLEARKKRTSGREYRELKRRVKEYMEMEHPYRDASFRLSDLAKAVGSTPTDVSLMLNQNLDTNFYDFINRYRLDEFKARMTDGRTGELSMMAVAERCGFRRSTFFSVFKKFEGCTPNEYIKTLKHP